MQKPNEPANLACEDRACKVEENGGNDPQGGNVMEQFEDDEKQGFASG